MKIQINKNVENKTNQTSAKAIQMSFALILLLILLMGLLMGCTGPSNSDGAVDSNKSIIVPLTADQQIVSNGVEQINETDTVDVGQVY
jgi:hypothetical protein